jgi:D-alanyl-D-alanine carboxypeptidase (penicillin-binding protein 5/6)
VIIVVLLGLVIVQVERPLPSQHVAIARTTVIRVPAGAMIPWPSSGESAVEIDGVVRTSGSQTPVPIASLAKMMTAYIVLKDHPITAQQTGPSIPITSADAATYALDAAASDSVLKVIAGESLPESQALEALLIASADNIADVLAQWDSGSISAFVAKMNATAHSLGMSNTKYTDPSGLAATTVSTARDQLIMTTAAMAIPALANIVAMPEASFPDGETIQNFNYDVGHFGVIGVKTGSDSAAQGCWAFAAKRAIGGIQQLVYGVVLGIPATSEGFVEPALSAGVALANTMPFTVRSIVAAPASSVVGYVTAPWRKNPVPLTALHSVAGFAQAGGSVSLRLEVQGLTGTTVRRSQRLGSLIAHGLHGASNTPVVAEDAGSGPSLLWRLTRL